MKKLNMKFDKNIFKSRTVLGLICIFLSLLVCFGITPLFNRSLTAQAEIVRVRSDVAEGAHITEAMLETVTVGAYNLPDNAISDKSAVVGQYAAVPMEKGDYVFPGKLSAEPLTDSPYLARLDGTQVAVSVTIPSLAAGLSGKLEAGDIISVIATDSNTNVTAMRPELQYVRVLAATASTGADKTYKDPAAETDEEAELPSTLTLLVNMEQARVLAELEQSSKIHAALVYRGPEENAEQFLTEQVAFFEKDSPDAPEGQEPDDGAPAADGGAEAPGDGGADE